MLNLNNSQNPRNKPVINIGRQTSLITGHQSANKSTNIKNMLNNNKANGNKNIKCLLIKNNKEQAIFLSGKKAGTILALKNVKNLGLKTLEAIGSGLPRISSYINLLRHEDGINILTIREENRKGRYVLIDIIEILT